MELMSDPVIAKDGKSYERTAIEKYWAREGKPISPLTREVLPSKDLWPNLNLKQLCAEYEQKRKRDRLAAAQPTHLVMAALLAPPTPARDARAADASAEGKGAVGGAGSSRTALGAKRPRRLDGGKGKGPEVEPSSSPKRACIAM